MAQFISLEEAARVLGITPEELRDKVQNREIVGYMGDNSWQFRSADIEEYARQMGQGSSPELNLPNLSGAETDDSGIDLDLNLGFNEPLGSPIASAATPAGEGSSALDNLDDLDDVLLFDESDNLTTSSSSKVINTELEGVETGSADSDVRMVPNGSNLVSDSDVRISPAASEAVKPAEPVMESPPVAQEEPSSPLTSDFDLPIADDDPGFAPIGSGQSPTDSEAELLDPLASDTGASFPVEPTDSQTLAKFPPADSSSDVDFGPASTVSAPDQGSDFEVSAMDHLDELEPTPLKNTSDLDVTAGGMASSGINLGRPSGSGINLLADSDGFDEFQAKPFSDSSAQIPAMAGSVSAGEAPKPGGDNLFDDTGFDVEIGLGPDDDRTANVSMDSDSDLGMSDDSRSVISLDDEPAVDAAAATSLRKGLSEDESVEVDLINEEPSGDESDVVLGTGPELAQAGTMAGAGAAAGALMAASAEAGPAVGKPRGVAQAEWGGVWVGLLGVGAALLMLLSFLGIDLARNMSEFNGETPVASGLIQTIADLLG